MKQINHCRKSRFADIAAARTSESYRGARVEKPRKMPAQEKSFFFYATTLPFAG
jgi:hypothetical protein